MLDGEVSTRICFIFNIGAKKSQVPRSSPARRLRVCKADSPWYKGVETAIRECSMGNALFRVDINDPATGTGDCSSYQWMPNSMINSSRAGKNGFSQGIGELCEIFGGR